MNWPPVGVVWVWVGGNYRNIEFLGNLQAHSHVLNICDNFLKINIQIAHGFLFPKHTLISINAFLMVEQN